MTKAQRYRYEMFVRVRDFGAANRDAFPELSSGGRRFTQVGEAVDALELQLTRRSQARAEARRVKTNTRRAVSEYMKAIASTGRRAAEAEAGTNAFRMPTRKSAAAVLNIARLFIEEAERRKEKFLELGMPETFLTDFQALVDDLDEAVRVRLSSRTVRRLAQAGIETALRHGFDAIRDLDVVVPNAMRQNVMRLESWDGARRIEGQGSSPRPAKAVVPAPVVAAPPAAPDVASPPAAPGPTPGEAVPDRQHEAPPLMRAS